MSYLGLWVVLAGSAAEALMSPSDPGMPPPELPAELKQFGNWEVAASPHVIPLRDEQVRSVVFCSDKPAELRFHVGGIESLEGYWITTGASVRLSRSRAEVDVRLEPEPKPWPSTLARVGKVSTSRTVLYGYCVLKAPPFQVGVVTDVSVDVGVKYPERIGAASLFREPERELRREFRAVALERTAYDAVREHSEYLWRVWAVGRRGEVLWVFCLISLLLVACAFWMKSILR
jgi:hypothetical protein